MLVFPWRRFLRYAARLDASTQKHPRDKFSRRRDFRRRANLWFHVSCWAYREHPFRLRLIRAELGNCFSGNHG
jgi:hypothetical protein